MEVMSGLDESSFSKEVGLELVKDRKGNEEVEVANIIDKSLKKFKRKWGGNKLGSSRDVVWLGAVTGKCVWKKCTVWESRDLSSNLFPAINQLRRP